MLQPTTGYECIKPRLKQRMVLRKYSLPAAQRPTGIKPMNFARAALPTH